MDNTSILIICKLCNFSYCLQITYYTSNLLGYNVNDNCELLFLIGFYWYPESSLGTLLPEDKGFSSPCNRIRRRRALSVIFSLTEWIKHFIPYLSFVIVNGWWVLEIYVRFLSETLFYRVICYKISSFEI